MLKKKKLTHDEKLGDFTSTFCKLFYNMSNIHFRFTIMWHLWDLSKSRTNNNIILNQFFLVKTDK